ncbi:hypothetical protein [Marixanthomonas spongiae]|uniref:Bulb-type lectin domain-containing protein n=1 Tax=Marixanthomonas spongiae TaxID=2174845 RepID=A0A2U0HZ79_9FLAO|nr:hypothetical protein [Marixanthomonas spongiae]PVW14126.1 hypothetical protein DDV96_09935 [Marixanthomonas spongiae]
MKKNSLTYKILIIFLVVGIVSCKDPDSPREEEEEIETTPEFQGEIDYIKTYGGSELDKAVSVVLANDGNYVVLGTTQSTDGDITDKTTTDEDFWLLKIKPDGEIIWSKTYGGPEDDTATGLEKTNDGGYIASGYSRGAGGDVSNNEGFHDFWIVKFNASGDLQWEKSFGFPGSDKAYKARQTKDGGYIAVGVLDVSASNGEGGLGSKRPGGKTSRSPQHAGGDYWAIKLSSTGELQWRNYFGGTFTDTAYDVQQTADGSYLVFGTSDSFDVDISENIGTYDFWVVKVSANGELVWGKNYGGTQIENLYAATTTADGNFMMFGDTRSNDEDVSGNFGKADIWGVKIDAEGTLLSQQSYGGSEFESARGITQLSNGNFIITGNTRSTDGDFNGDKGDNDALAMVIDDKQSMQFQITIGGSTFDFAQSAVEAEKSSYVIVGSTQSNDKDIPQNRGVEDILLIKLK